MTQATQSTSDDTRRIRVKGRDITVRRLVDTQVVLLAREGRLLQKSTIMDERKLVAMGRVFDILESAVISEEDREYLLDLTVARELELDDMLQIVKAFAGNNTNAAPVVRRGRPSKRV